MTVPRPARPACSGFQVTELVAGTGDFIWGASRLRSAPSCRRDYPNLGRVGKKNLKIFLDQLKIRWWATVCGILASGVDGGCAADLGEHLQSGRVLAWYGLQGRWSGPVVPTERACGPATHGLMSIGERGFGLDPFQSTAVIRGKVGDDGRLSGSLIRQDADHKDHSIVFEGMAAGSDAISGTLQSGRCSWTVTLHRG
jgi:hypothetical protein